MIPKIPSMSDLGYLSGYRNEHETEAVAGALPLGMNSPQKPPFGLFAEQFSETAFTAAARSNFRSWLYRTRPSAMHDAYEPYAGNASFGESRNAKRIATPNRLRWDPMPDHHGVGKDFVDGLYPYCGFGSEMSDVGVGIYTYVADTSMKHRAFYSADGQLLLVPSSGALSIRTELGRLDVPPGFCCIIPRGIRFSIALDGLSKGYVCENFGAPLSLPERGPIGANGLANARDFQAPTAWFEDTSEHYEVVQKYGGTLWTTTLTYSPYNVVAWHGNSAPYRYDLNAFNAMGSITFDHPDPSIFTVLTSQSSTPGIANLDFVLFRPRWLVMEDTFRPPWFHRNVMSEFMGLVKGRYDAKAEGFTPGGASLHNRMSAHGPDKDTWRQATDAELAPEKLENTLAFMFETTQPLLVEKTAFDANHRQPAYDACWEEFPESDLSNEDAL